MIPWLIGKYGNPSSLHLMGREARKALETAREQVAVLVDADPEQVIFTSGATEANNAALHCVSQLRPEKKHIITSSVEHSAILAYCENLEKHHGFEVTRLPVDSSGLLDLKILENSIRPDTALVSLMWANNETGVIWSVADIADCCRAKGVLFHTDAVQAVGKVDVSFNSIRPDFLSLSGHKFGAPKGVGALILADPYKFQPMLVGGKQEHGLRGGTENVPSIIALGKAAEILFKGEKSVWGKVETMRDLFESKITHLIGGSKINGEGAKRLKNTSNVFLKGIDGDAAVLFLDTKGIMVSSGSACMESALSPSHVISAMHGFTNRANQSIRISIGISNSENEIDELVSALLLLHEMIEND